MALFRRYPEVEPLVERINENFNLNFSHEQTVITIGTLKLSRKFPGKDQSGKKFDLKFECTLSCSPPLIPRDKLCSLLKIDNKTVNLEPSTQKESSATGLHIITSAEFNKNYKITLDPEIIANNIGTKGDIERKEIKLDLKFEKFYQNFNHPAEKKISLDSKAGEIFTLTLTPESPRDEIKLEPTKNADGNNGINYNVEEDKYRVPYSVSKPVKQLFTINVSNRSKYSFSYPLDGKISLKIFDVQKELTLRKSNDVFHLDESATWDGTSSIAQEKTVSLAHNTKENNFYFYVNFAGIGKNSEYNRHFQINLLFSKNNSEPVTKRTINLSITPSLELTEPLIQIIPAKEELLAESGMEPGYKNNYFIVHFDDDEKELQLSANVPSNKSTTTPIIIEGNKDIELFTLRLANRCNTGNGYYKWEIQKVVLEQENNNSDKKDGELLTYGKKEGIIKDNIASIENVPFSLRPENLNKDKFEFSLKVKFDLIIRFFPDGQANKEPKSDTVKIETSIACRHDVDLNYLVIDFGTSAIAVEHCVYSPEDDRWKRKHLELKSLDSLRKSEYGMLSSVMNLNSGEKIGDAEFINLPVANNFLSLDPNLDPEIIITGLKLLILDGSTEIPAPAKFEIKDDKGNKAPGNQMGLLSLEMLFQSAYKNLKTKYILDLVKNYKRIIITHPNAYNKTHQEFLRKIVRESLKDENNNIYEENIDLISESNAVLYDYLAKKSFLENKPEQENIIVFDIGGGTLDISQAEVVWGKNKPYPTSITVKKRDGTTFAGEILDKAIALQVHQILEEYDKRYAGASPSRPQQSTGEKRLVAKKSARELLRKTVTSRKITEPESASRKAAGLEDIMIVENTSLERNFYFNKIARKRNDLSINDIEQLDLMLDFKYNHILNFKKEMSKADKEDKVAICLGDNSGLKSGGLCMASQDKYEADIEIKGKDRKFKSEIENRSGYLYLSLNKNDWLDLPYLSEFKNLFIEKLKSFKNSDSDSSENENNNNLDNAHFILSGRASLWPQIPESVEEVFGKRPEYIFNKNTDHLDLYLKRSVANGALQKIVFWSEDKIPFKDCPTGKPAIFYQKGTTADYQPIREGITLIPGAPGKDVDLTSSPIFDLGIKSSLGFYPFIGGTGFRRNNYTGKTNIKISVEENENTLIGYDFFVESDTIKKKTKLEFEHRVKTRSSNRWPIKPMQLPDVAPHEFNKIIDKEIYEDDE